MIYFPTSYPNERWYSVLCRYHVRSGYWKHATTSHELYGNKSVTHSRLFPGTSIHTIASRHPAGIDEKRPLILYEVFNEKQRAFNYNQWLHYFITSVSWRHLYLDLLDFVQNGVVGLDALERLIESEQIMRDYLLEKQQKLET